MSAVVVKVVTDGPNWAEIVVAVSTALAVLIGIPTAVTALAGRRRDRERDRRERYYQLVEFARGWDRPELLEARLGLRQYASPEELKSALEIGRLQAPDTERVLLRVPTFFEDLGSMVRYGIMDEQLVRTIIGSAVIAYWQMWVLAVAWLRHESGSPEVYENFEWLSNLLSVAAR